MAVTALIGCQGIDSTGTGQGEGDDSLGPTGSGPGTGTAGGSIDGSGTGPNTSEPTTGGSTGTKFDVGGGDSTGAGSCECGTSTAFSYIWIANSTQSTITKLNTVTMVEEGRYLTRDTPGNPSRTSVSIDGRAVAVANRSGGLTKVWAQPAFCDPMKNGTAGLQTASDLNFLAWGEDDCVAWHVPFAHTTQRPVAWGPGTLDPISCEYENQVVWTGGCDPAVDTWAWAHRVDGETGAILDTIEVVGFDCGTFSPYGGAIDPNGDFWMSSLLIPDPQHVAHFSAAGALIEVIDAPLSGYGITVDSVGRVWLASFAQSAGVSAARYTPGTGAWDLASNKLVNSASGIQEDAEGRMWMNAWTVDAVSTQGIVPIDGDTMDVLDPVNLGCSDCRGLSIDFEGNVWSTSMGQGRAFRYNPDTTQLDSYDQLVSPYTYSDMTGWALQNVGCNPEG